MLNALHDAECRFAANKVLEKYLVQAPEEIDLETIAWLTGRLRIEYGDLDTAEGRLTASSDGGIIRINSSITNEGRRRFTIAHELGHFCLHKDKVSYDSANDFHVWDEGSKETQANVFAGELLMPERLLKPLLPSYAPNLKTLDLLADKFKTSSLATGVQFITYTMEPYALIIAKDGVISWVRKSKGFEFFIEGRQRLPSCSAAGEILSGKCGNTNGMVKTPAWAWLPRVSKDSRSMIMEDSRYIEAHKTIVTLLWIDEDIDDG